MKTGRRKGHTMGKGKRKSITGSTCSVSQGEQSNNGEQRAHAVAHALPLLGEIMLSRASGRHQRVCSLSANRISMVAAGLSATVQTGGIQNSQENAY